MHLHSLDGAIQAWPRPHLTGTQLQTLSAPLRVPSTHLRVSSWLQHSAGKTSTRGTSAETQCVSHMAWRQCGRILGVTGADGKLQLFDMRRMDKALKHERQHAFSGALGQFAWVNGGSALVGASASEGGLGGFRVIQVRFAAGTGPVT